jgi:integrase
MEFFIMGHDLRTQGFEPQESAENQSNRATVTVWMRLSSVEEARESVLYAVSYRERSGKRKLRQKKFRSREKAYEQFRLWSEGSESPWLRVENGNTIDEQTETAKKIQRRENVDVSPSLPLLFALEFLDSRSRDTERLEGYRCGARATLAILSDKHVLPPHFDNKRWSAWGATAAQFLLESETGGQPPAFDTAKMRIGFLKRALTCLETYAYSFQHADELVACAAIARAAVAREFKKLGPKLTRKRKTLRPIGAAEIIDLLEKETDLRKRALMLKLLFGFRPPEAFHASYSDIFAHHLQLHEVVKKTVPFGHEANYDIEQVYAPLWFRLLTRLEQNEAFRLRFESYEQALKTRPRKDPVCLRRLRTVAACHLYLATLNLETVRSRCGHHDLTMAKNHYTKFVRDLKKADNQTADEYYSIDEMHIDGVDGVLAQNENAYDRFLLALLFEFIVKRLPTKEAMAIIMNELRAQQNRQEDTTKKRRFGGDLLKLVKGGKGKKAG